MNIKILSLMICSAVFIFISQNLSANDETSYVPDSKASDKTSGKDTNKQHSNSKVIQDLFQKYSKEHKESLSDEEIDLIKKDSADIALFKALVPQKLTESKETEHKSNEHNKKKETHPDARKTNPNIKVIADLFQKYDKKHSGSLSDDAIAAIKKDGYDTEFLKELKNPQPEHKKNSAVPKI